jgi:hypothetical protein
MASSGSDLVHNVPLDVTRIEIVLDPDSGDLRGLIVEFRVTIAGEGMSAKRVVPIDRTTLNIANFASSLTSIVATYLREEHNNER